MENNKIINFQIFRYHLLPISSFSNQIELFPKPTLDVEELKKKKNEIFVSILNSLISKNKVSLNPLKLEVSEDNVFLLKIASKKRKNIIQNFESKEVANEPYVYVIINNDSDIQKIAISENLEAFSSVKTVKNILKKIFNNELAVEGLNIEIEQLFDVNGFWKLAQKYKDLITMINFRFIKPNLANISKSLPVVFRNFTDNVNSHESNIIIKAPEKGVLENISKKNESVNGLVEYSSEGAGEIKLKVKTMKRQLSTNEEPVIEQIKEIDIEGSAEQVIKLYKEIVK